MFYLNQIRNPIWNFDATGSILKPIKNQKKPYLYSIVSYDPQNHINIPFCEWFSTSHSQSSISQFLFTLKNILLKYASISTKKLLFKFAPIVVTDFSFALLNSVLVVFNCEMRRRTDDNKHEMLVYLEIAFELLVLNKNDRFENLITLIYICSTHYLYNFIKKVKKVTTPKEKKNNKNEEHSNSLKRCAIFCFSLLINAISLTEFETYLKNIYFFFMEKTQSSFFLASILFIRERIKERKVPFLVSVDQCSKDRQRSENFFELYNKNNLDFSKENRKSIMKNSPFTDYFNKQLLNYSGFLQKDLSEKKKNPFYSPELFNLIQKTLYLAPVWSGFFINEHFKRNEQFYTDSYYTKKKPTKLENNRVENRFDNLKNDILQDNRVYPSEYAKLTYSNLHSQYINPANDYISRQHELSKQLTKLDEYDENGSLLKKVQTEFREPSEKWENASEKRKRLKKSHNGGYFDNISNFGYLSNKQFKKDTRIPELDEGFVQDHLHLFDSLIKTCESKWLFLFKIIVEFEVSTELDYLRA
jgi:hypothetical protein